MFFGLGTGVSYSCFFTGSWSFQLQFFTGLGKFGSRDKESGNFLWFSWTWKVRVPGEKEFSTPCGFHGLGKSMSLFTDLESPCPESLCPGKCRAIRSTLLPILQKPDC